jgi:hypothetical protein
MERMRNDPMALSYWTGYLDGVQIAFEMMRPEQKEEAQIRAAIKRGDG